MKKLILLLLAINLTAACNQEQKNQSLDSLESQRNSLTLQIDSLNTLLNAVDAQIARQDTLKRLPIVTVLPLNTELFKHYIEIQGIVKADKNIELRPELGGTVSSIAVKEGQYVKKGQLLVQLDDALISSSSDELKTQLELAKTTFERQERLWAQKIGSEMQYLQAKTQYESLQNSLASIETQADKMKIVAPFSGIVDEIFPNTGELTSPQFPVVRLINLDKVYIETEITETYLPVVEKGTEVQVYFSSIAKNVEANISQVGNYINPDNRSFKARIDLVNKDHTIKPNLLADLKVLDYEGTGFSFPAELVQQDQFGNDFVYVLNSNNDETKIDKRIITVANEYEQQVFVQEGLSEGDILVNSGARLVKSGDQVKVISE